MKTNKEKLVMQSVIGSIHSPTARGSYVINSKGEAMTLPSVGGITYNFTLGDSCMDLVGDHVEPDVSIKNDNDMENQALMKMSCVGNIATVVSGEHKGAQGIVLGMHGGIDHTIIHFSKEDKEKLTIGDKIMVKGYGTGMIIEGYEDIHCMNLDPELFERLPIKEKDGKLEFPVVATIPAHLMGSGIGSSTGHTGDYDIMTGDHELNEKHGINDLRFGDFVFLENCDNTYGRQYLSGAGTIGIVIHSNCVLSGHGPGITTLLSSKDGKIIPRIDKKANLKNYVK